MTTQTVKSSNKRSTEHLRPYQFKPGNNANPKGRPKAILTKHERLEILSEIAKHDIESEVSAGHKIAAIKEANLMEHVYQTPLDGNINVVFVVGKGYKETPQSIIKGTARLITDGDSQNTKQP